jgi:hypothetical protein
LYLTPTSDETALMDASLLHRVYKLINGIIHPIEFPDVPYGSAGNQVRNLCPVTKLDISMQPGNSKFISALGAKWYHDHKISVFEKILLPYLKDQRPGKPPEQQFIEIAHNIRNADSNPRNNARRAVKKILDDKHCLFDNRELIDRNKLEAAGLL